MTALAFLTDAAFDSRDLLAWLVVLAAAWVASPHIDRWVNADTRGARAYKNGPQT